MNYYFLGIGGIGMSALARYFHRCGNTVSGYDRTPSLLTAELESEGISIHYDDAPDRLPDDIDFNKMSKQLLPNIADKVRLTYLTCTVNEQNLIWLFQ